MLTRITSCLVISCCFSVNIVLGFQSRVVSYEKARAGYVFKLRGTMDEHTNGEDDKKKTDSNTLRNSASTVSKRKKRSVDFPSFAYDGDNVKNKYPKGLKNQFLVRVREHGANKERVYTSRMVQVPEKEEPERSLIVRLLLSLVNNSYSWDALLPAQRQTRLLKERAYANKAPFAAENITIPPSLQDLASLPRKPFENFWISSQARILSFIVSFYAFPFLTRFLDKFVTMESQQLDDIASKFNPGISILYGTFISLTLSILYDRQREIQDNAAMETSLIIIVLRNILSLFKGQRDLAIEAAQCVADQIRTLVKSSRGEELMLLMYSDPYARLLEMIDRFEDDYYLKEGDLGSKASRIGFCRDTVKDLNRLRANRLSDEALALPPTHFLILNTLTALILLSYTISILPTVPTKTGEPSIESSILFAVLTTIYVLFYNFADDLNNPFRGVYQVRRSCAASHLLGAKWLIANHPVLQGEVDFEGGEEDLDGDEGVLIRTPGLGDFVFQRDDLLVDEKKEVNEGPLLADEQI